MSVENVSQPTSAKAHERSERLHEINMFAPKFRNQTLRDQDNLAFLEEGELSGMKDNPHNSEWRHDAHVHMKLCQAFGGKLEAVLADVLKTSRDAGLPDWTDRSYVYDGGKPDYYRHAEEAITKSEGNAKAQAIREKLEDIDGLDKVVSRLKAHDK